MRLKRKKKIDMRETGVLSSDTAFAESAKALAKAQEIAEWNKDIDAIVAISDRWAVLARTLEQAENENVRIPIGFGLSNEEENDNS